MGSDSQTIDFNHPMITVSGIPDPQDPSGVFAVSSTTITPSLLPETTQFVVGGETFAVDPTNIVVDGNTLTPGGAEVTVSGGVVSLGATALMVGSKTEVFSPSETSASGGLGALILSGLGQIGGASVTSNPTVAPIGVTPFLGAARKGLSTGSAWVCITTTISWALHWVCI